MLKVCVVSVLKIEQESSPSNESHCRSPFIHHSPLISSCLFIPLMKRVCPASAVGLHLVMG